MPVKLFKFCYDGQLKIADTNDEKDETWEV
jgi:hypothetical protein